ncbi:TrmH family RNA methyltransferase [Pseudogracilibacillus auburnensis]|uniref:TrmH family RNA methyltransferase n=1 Tax=Pseudogracilibacillus auburnensis TaxID=1494959 RepID=UPI001F60E24E|nr:RNA methyltransferase [Pseudogracilibacillus auburnensis]
MQVITSIQNNQVKNWRKLHTKKYRTEMKCFLIEGFHLIEEAYKSGWEIDTIIVREGVDVPDWSNQYTITYVDERVFKEVTQTEKPQGIAAVVKMKKLEQKADDFVLLVDAIQDPGNLGTIIRTADAAGFSKIVNGVGTVDHYNDKVIRASQGSIFHIPIEQDDILEAIKKLKNNEYTIWASALEDAIDYHDIEGEEKTALIVGNEGAGIEEAVLQAADHIVKIPIYGQAESLNVSVAAGILMYKMRK